ncbi:hypothetical protein YPD27_4535 [Yersinia pestis KIM D27]|nr:hypothetical protein YpMG051020_3461 [Yersinia pestis biovar Orientalis str. MG05-1020]EDR66437.1 hypothetical protein YpK1973002_3978 [Yersinia pestis biovar Mediaevalis str. K1973002]EFA50206.1 hypothetical protein YPD27_4535 [Yersinia pestis KIM D27]EIS95927.1 hypothetical protein YPPY89_2529 [Yersinia pestis PY-89]
MPLCEHKVNYNSMIYRKNMTDYKCQIAIAIVIMTTLAARH